MNNWGVAVDQATGRVWVARPVAGEVLVFDAELTLVSRIKVGCAPRDLAIDQKRRVILIGNYTDGTVSLVNMDTMRVYKTLRFPGRWPVARLRGVLVGIDGKWYVSTSSGVWAIDPIPAAGR